MILNPAIFRENSLSERYLPPEDLESLFKDIPKETIGYSEGKREIKAIKIGEGQIRVLAWSQMHGNESTATKALVDIINFLTSNHPKSKQILKEITLYAILQLNPDGSKMYTRVNINSIDLNRDAYNLSQSESITLKAYVKKIKPDFCFNLHDQRTIYGVGNGGNPAVISFLSPCADKEKSLTPSRLKAMGIISHINNILQTIIPNKVGRYDDTFNINCTGDMFTSVNIPVILFESGQYDFSDYDRSQSRNIVFTSIYIALRIISETEGVSGELKHSKHYFSIPENKKSFVDILIKNPIGEKTTYDLEILFEEKLTDGKIIFHPYILNTKDSVLKYAHLSYENISVEEALREASSVIRNLSTKLIVKK